MDPETLSYFIKDLLLPITTTIAVMIGLIALYQMYRKSSSFSIKIGSASLQTKKENTSVSNKINQEFKSLNIKDRDKIIELINNEIQNNKAFIRKSVDSNDIEYDVEKFNEYHTNSINQSKISFWFSLVFASIGFVIIGTSIFIYDNNTAYIGIIAGTIIDAVSALFFYQSNKARKLMSEFFDKLRADRKYKQSLKLCDSIDDEFIRNTLKVKLSLYFSGLVDSHNIAKEIIDKANSQREIKKNEK